MDALELLKQEMELKRKAINGNAGGSKYIKRADMEAARQQQYWEEQKKLEEKRLARKRGSGSEDEGPSKRREGSVDLNDESDKAATDDVSHKKIAAKEVIKRLRRRGEPIRMFGETDEERVERLRLLERATPDESLAQQNVFMANIKGMDRRLDLEALQRTAEGESVHEAEHKQQQKKKELFLPVADEPVTTEVYARDKEKVSFLIHNFFMHLLNEWDSDLSKRPDEVKRSAAGKVEYVTMEQSKEYLKPFFKLLRKKQMPDDMLLHLTRIVQCLQHREYVSANDTYYLLSIGNAPWPIGVTMVGIHERSAREKIFSNQVAHVLNDEKSRKWIQSMKRLMTFCQDKYLPDDLAKTVGWVKPQTPQAPKSTS